MNIPCRILPPHDLQISSKQNLIILQLIPYLFLRQLDLLRCHCLISLLLFILFYLSRNLFIGSLTTHNLEECSGDHGCTADILPEVTLDDQGAAGETVEETQADHRQAGQLCIQHFHFEEASRGSHWPVWHAGEAQNVQEALV